MKKKQIFYFTSKTCRPCQILGPLMDELSKTYNIQKVDIDSNHYATEKYHIKSVPTILTVEDDIVIDRKVGIHTKQSYIEMFEK